MTTRTCATCQFFLPDDDGGDVGLCMHGHNAEVSDGEMHRAHGRRLALRTYAYESCARWEQDEDGEP